MQPLVRYLALVLMLSALVFGQQPKIAASLAGSSPGSTVDVIVQFAIVPTAAHHQKVANLGGSLKTPLNAIKGAAYNLPAAALTTLAGDPDVVYISENRPVHNLLDNTASAVNASAAWQLGWDGTGVGVALVDSGITNMPDLSSNPSAAAVPAGPAGPGFRVIYSQDFIGGNGQDGYGHGEHVAGIVAANGSGSNCPSCFRKLKGIAPNANLLNFRVLDATGQGTDSSVIAAIDQVISLKAKYNIRVLNISLGRPVYESYTVDPLCQAVEAAWKAGIVVVVAAGNDGRNNSSDNNGYSTINAPGNDPYVITVGAMKTNGTPERTDDTIASYSSKGPTLIDYVVKPDIVAPGNMVVSLLAPGPAITLGTYPSNQVANGYFQSTGPAPGPGPGPGAGGPQNGASNYYLQLSGTSMATPVVSAAAALLIQANPNLSPDQVKARLMRTAYKTFPASSQAQDPTTGTIYTSYYDAFTVGAGYLDIRAALFDTTPFSGTALCPPQPIRRPRQIIRLGRLHLHARFPVYVQHNRSGARNPSGVLGQSGVRSRSGALGRFGVLGRSGAPNLSGVLPALIYSMR